MAKLTTDDEDVGLVGVETLTSDGDTNGITAPAERLLELVIDVPVGVTATLQASYDAGASYKALSPSSLSVVDATAAAVSTTMQYFTQEEGIRLGVAASGTWSGGTLTFRVSGPAKR